MKIAKSTLQNKEKSHKNPLTYCIFQKIVYFTIIWYSFEDIHIKNAPSFKGGHHCLLTLLFVNILCRHSSSRLAILISSLQVVT